MKTNVDYSKRNRIIIILIFALIIMVGYSCTPEGHPVYNNDNLAKTYYFELTPEGASGETMEGNLLIDAPAGAVTETLTISIKQGPEEDHNGFLLKSVKISPSFLSYNKPLKISFKYNGELLSNGSNPGEGTMDLYCFPNEKAYEEWVLYNVEPMCECTLNAGEETIEAFICRNGIFAIYER